MFPICYVWSLRRRRSGRWRGRRGRRVVTERGGDRDDRERSDRRERVGGLRLRGREAKAGRQADAMCQPGEGEERREERRRGRRREGTPQVDGAHIKAAAPRRGPRVNDVTSRLLQRADVKRARDPPTRPTASADFSPR